jgi:hypothetical protein
MCGRGFYMRGVYKVENRRVEQSYKMEELKQHLIMEEVCPQSLRRVY